MIQVFKKYIIIFLSDVVAIIFFVIKKIPTFRRGNAGKRKLRILIYHSISDKKDVKERNISIKAFKQHMFILKKSSKTIIALSEGISSLKKGNLTHDSVAITFDDGGESVYNEALKVLEDLQISATFFIIYKYIESSEEYKERHMSWSMVFSLKEKGFEIGSHSYSHQRLTTLKDEDLHRETAYAKEKFEEKGIQVEYFAYPYGAYGDFSEETESFVKEAGYKACLVNVMGDNFPGDNLFRLKRTRISWRDNPFRFKMRINGAYDWVDTLKYKLQD